MTLHQTSNCHVIPEYPIYLAAALSQFCSGGGSQTESARTSHESEPRDPSPTGA